MTTIIPYLQVSNGLEAIKLYKKAFNAEQTEHSPFTPEIGIEMGFPDDFDYESSTMHAGLKIYGCDIFLSDGNQDKIPSTVEVVLNFDNEDDIREAYQNCVSNGFEVIMELEKQFWNAIYGRLRDPFGVGWQLNFDL